MHITTDLLQQYSACEGQVRLFQKTFPDSADNGVDVTVENWELAKSAGLDLLWLYKILPETVLSEYWQTRDAARAEYDRVCSATYAEFERVRKPAYAEYRRAYDAAGRTDVVALAEYQRVTGPTRTEYLRVEKPAYAEYRRVLHEKLFLILENL